MWSALVILLIAPHICRVDGQVNRTNINVTSVLGEPFLMYISDNDNANGSKKYVGYIPDLLKEISDITTLDFNIHLAADGNFREHDNDTWRAMASELLGGKAHIAVAPFTVNAEREEVADFTQPYMETGITFMIPKPKVRSNVISFLDVLTVVSGEVWGLIFVAIVVLVISMMIIDRYYPDPRASFGWKDSAMFLFSTWMWQGYPKAPPSQAARIIALFWWFFCAVFLMSYGASLVQVFALRVETQPRLAAKVPEDLPLQSELRYSTVDEQSAKDFFSNSKLELLKHLWVGMQHYGLNSFPKNVSEGVAKVREGRYALFAESHVLDYYANIDPDCALLVSDHRLDEKGYAIAVYKSHPELYHQLDAAIITLKANGMTAELYKRYFADQCPRHFIQQYAEDRIELQRQPINLANFGGMFIILIIGLSGGFLVFALEAILMRKYMGQSQTPALLMNDDL